MSQRFFGLALSTMLYALCPPVEAQQPKRVPRIVYLSTASSAPIAARFEAFRQGLSELGYMEGKNIFVEWRHAEGKLERLPEIVAELVRLNVNVIVTSGSVTTRPAKKATNAIPIVMTQDPDPIGNGFVASLARPGGNITGLSNLNRELSGKRLEILKEVLPTLNRVAVLGTLAQPGHAQALKDTEVAAVAFGVKLQYLDVLDPKEIETAFRAADKGGAEAVLTLGGTVLNRQTRRVVDLAAKSRLPAMYSIREYVEVGGLMSYGASVTDLDRRAATYVDKILKGTKPADLPVEQPTKFELVINLKTAKQIGLTIPPNVLARADRVIR